MIIPGITRLESFVLQYIVATLSAIFVFYTLRKKSFYSKPTFIIRRPVSHSTSVTELIGYSFFSSLEKVVGTMIHPIVIASSVASVSGVPCSEMRTGYTRNQQVQPSLSWVKKSMLSFKAPGTRVHFPAIYQKKSVYDAYVALFSISVWAGILLLLTPYKSIFVFIPHFSSLTLNLSIIIVLAITIFEGTISTIFLFSGTSPRRVSLVALSVLAVFSLSILTPSFTWFHTYTLGGGLLIYTILAALIISITLLISLFKEKGTLFKLAFYSSIVSYAFFIIVTTYNISLTIIPAL